MNKNYKVPAIAWLKMTDYMHGWLQSELGGGVMVGGKKVVCMQHLPGAKKALRMETVEDMMEKGNTGNAMSATRHNCIEAGMKICPDVVEELYGVTKEGMDLYVPVECPKMCLTRNGVLRTWTLDVCFGQGQATALQRLLRDEFWKAVTEYSEAYALEHSGMRYAQIDMIEDFCQDTDTPDMYADTIRREWQRRIKRKKETPCPAEMVSP